MAKIIMIILVVILIVSIGGFAYFSYVDSKEIAFDEDIAETYFNPEAVPTQPEQPKKTSSWSDSSEDAAYFAEAQVEQAEEAEPEAWAVDLEGLRAINPDCIGWIWLPGTSINYPVVQGSDNSYYLKHRFDGSYSKEGAIFMDAQCSETDNNFVLYGHNTSSGKFEPLVDYIRYGKSFWEEHPYFVYYSEEYPEGVIYDIFSTFRANISNKSAAGQIYMVAGDQDYPEYQTRLKGWGNFDTGIEVSPDRKVIILSTCGYGANKRCVICGIARN